VTAALVLCAVAALLRGAGPEAQSVASGQAAATRQLVTVVSQRGRKQLDVRTARGFPALRVSELSEVLSLVGRAPQAGVAELRVLGQRLDLVLDAPYFRFGSRVYGLAGTPYAVGDSLFVPLQLAVEYLPRLFTGRYRFDASRGQLEELAGRPAVGPEERVEAPPAEAAVPVARAARRRVARVVGIDPGHGGADVGMLGPIGRAQFLREKDVTLAIAREMASELGRRGIRAVLTRSRDTLVALRDRGRVASQRGADLFVSIHVNAANPRWRDAAAARGFETYFLAEARTEDARRVERMENESVRFETSADAPQGDPLSFILNDLAQNEHLRESSRLAELMQGNLERVHPAESRGVKQAGFAVLATSYMPAVLVEIGFGSNADEARYLVGQSGQRRLARALSDAVERYLAEYERRLAGPGAAQQ